TTTVVTESDPPMLPELTLPASLRRLLDAFAGCFTKPTFIVFTAMVGGIVAQTGSRTVCGMLAGAGLAQTWSHDRVHRFFAGHESGVQLARAPSAERCRQDGGVVGVAGLSRLRDRLVAAVGRGRNGSGDWRGRPLRHGDRSLLPRRVPAAAM